MTNGDRKHHAAQPVVPPEADGEIVDERKFLEQNNESENGSFNKMYRALTNFLTYPFSQ
jgi:hypothetical protein